MTRNTNEVQHCCFLLFLTDLLVSNISSYRFRMSILNRLKPFMTAIDNHNFLLLPRFAGFDAVTLANNHLIDFGSEGATLTADVLKKTGVKYFGITYGKYDSPQVH